MRIVPCESRKQAQELYDAGLLWWQKTGSDDEEWFDPQRFGFLGWNDAACRKILGYMVED